MHFFNYGFVLGTEDVSMRQKNEIINQQLPKHQNSLRYGTGVFKGIIRYCNTTWYERLFVNPVKALYRHRNFV